MRAILHRKQLENLEGWHVRYQQQFNSDVGQMNLGCQSICILAQSARATPNFDQSLANQNLRSRWWGQLATADKYICTGNYRYYVYASRHSPSILTHQLLGNSSPVLLPPVHTSVCGTGSWRTADSILEVCSRLLRPVHNTWKIYRLVLGGRGGGVQWRPHHLRW